MAYATRPIAVIRIAAQLALEVGLVWLACITTAAALSRDGNISQLRHTAWGAKEGAPAGSIYAITQTRDGYLWVSDGTLSRFDGLRFDRIDLPRDARLSSMRITRLVASASGGLWIGFNYGAGLLKDGQLTIYTERDGFPAGSASGFAEEEDGTAWASTVDGLARLEGSRWIQIGLDWDYPVGKTPVRSVMVDSAGTVWATSIGKAFFLTKGERRFRELKIPLLEDVELAESATGALWLEDNLGLRLIRKNKNATGLTASSSRGPLFDRDGGLWTVRSFTSGLYRIPYPEHFGDGRTILEKDIPKAFTEKDGLSSNRGSTIFEDREGNVWTGMAEGLNRFSNRNVIRAVVPSLPKGEPFSGPGSALAAADNGALWVIDSLRPLLNFKDGKINRHPEVPALNCAIRANDGSAWFAGSGKIWHYKSGKFTKTALPVGTNDFPVQAIAEGKDGVIWAAIQRHGLFQLTEGKWTAHPVLPLSPTLSAITMSTDTNGRVWAGYVDNQIAVLDNNSWQVFSRQNGIQIGNVSALFTRRSQIWAGGEFGLARFDKAQFKALMPNTEHMFDGITGIVETRNGELWLNGRAGIVRITAAEISRSVEDDTYRVRAEVFGSLDGLQGTSLRIRPLPTAIEGTDGRLWFSTSAGFFSIDPARIFHNPVPPQVLIESLNVDGKSYRSGTKLTLPKLSKAVRIDYVGLSLTMTEKVRYHYKLEGVDKGWQDAQSQRQALYTNLDPGTYQFHVIAANNDGVWNETGATLDFVIPPAFVQTGWFIALCIVGGMTMVGLLIRFRVKQISARLRGRLEARLAERERIARELHDTLLQSTQGLILRFQAVANGIPRSDPARETLEKALERADEVMAEGRDRVIDLRIPAHMWGDLQQAFATAGKDLAIESATVFRITADGAARALNANVREEIYAIGREALLNAFRHANAPLIEIEIVYAKQEFRLYVRDNGAGIEETILETGGRSGHWGLKGMRERAVAIGAKLNVLRRSEGGTQIEVSLPGGIAYKKRTMSSSMRSIRKFFGSTK
jgi:signal transduction histidine kinase/ligand-binding sensor domain-containing protein